MIEKTQSYKTSNGKIFGSIKEAQVEEIAVLIGGVIESKCAQEVFDMLVGNAEKVVDILTAKGSSKPKARSINGGTKKRTPRVQLPTLPTAG